MDLSLSFVHVCALCATYACEVVFVFFVQRIRDYGESNCGPLKDAKQRTTSRPMLNYRIIFSQQASDLEKLLGLI